MYEQYYHSKEKFFFVGHLSTDLRRDYYKLSPFWTNFTLHQNNIFVKMASLSFSEITRRMDTIKQEIENLRQQRLSPNIRSVLHISNNYYTVYLISINWIHGINSMLFNSIKVSTKGWPWTIIWEDMRTHCKIFVMQRPWNKR